MAKSPYELLNIHPNATPHEIRGVFRRFVARYRPFLTLQEAINDLRFSDCLNAYVQLIGRTNLPAAKSATRSKTNSSARISEEKPIVGNLDARTKKTAPKPFDALDDRAKILLMAHLAYWRGEMSEVTHQLRGYLDRFPDEASAWALLGEVLLSVGHMDDGLRAYKGAVKYAPQQLHYAKRLAHIEQCIAGKAIFLPESTPEEELLREERLRRWRIAALFGVFGIAILAATLFVPNLFQTGGFLAVPWRVVFLQCAGIFFLLSSLAFGRLLQPFDREMLWSSIYSNDRSGTSRHTPAGVLFLVLSLLCFWLALFGYLIMARTEEEWSYSILIWLGISLLFTSLTAMMLAIGHLPFWPMVIIGGNLPAVAGMIGWWVGSLFKSSYD